MKRRELLAASAAALAAPGCRRGAVKSTVAIARAAGYGGDLRGPILSLLRELRLDVRGRRVLLKPNLVEFDARTTINTHPLFVRAVWECFRELGAAEVRIGEGPGHRRGTLDLSDAAGYFQAFPDFERSFTDLNLDEVEEVRLRNPHSRLKSLYLPKTVLRADLIVSLPKLKTHHWVGATLGMKNLFGLVPGGVYGWPKNVLHWAGIAESIADLHNLFPRTFTIVDGIVGMEGNGPIQGKPKAAGVIVAGAEPGAVDATCCRIMGIDPLKVSYIQLVNQAGQADSRNIRVIGEPLGSVQARFELLPVFEPLRLSGL